MPAVITYQFRILNASNFIDTVTGIGASDPINSFYVTLGLPNAEAVGFGRTSNFCKFGSAEKKIILLGDSHFGSLAFDLRKRIETNYTFLPTAFLNCSSVLSKLVIS